MKAAVIPPFDYINTTRARKYHLVLSHLLGSPHGGYDEFYRTLKQHNEGAFVILDNSAHELTEGESIERMLTLGSRVNADEIVIPDHLFNREETVLNAKNALSSLLEPFTDIFMKYRPRLMFVAQGKSRKDYTLCWTDLSIMIRDFRRSFLDKFGFKPEITLGVSKDYEIFDGGLMRILKGTVIPIASSFGADVHILGWGHDLWAHRTIAEELGDQVRSTDSAKPWVYGYHSIFLETHYRDIPTYPKRDDDYFTLNYNAQQYSAALFNTTVFDATVAGEILP